MTSLDYLLMLYPSCALLCALAVIVARAELTEDIQMALRWLRSPRPLCDACQGPNAHPRLYGGSLCDDCLMLMAMVNDRPVIRDEHGYALMFLD